MNGYFEITLQNKMTSNTRENQKIQTLTRIKNSALIMFAHHGFSISVAKIADHAGISKQALMYHYPTKPQLLEAVIQDIEHSSFASLLQFFSLLLQQETLKELNELERIVADFIEQHLWAVLFLRLVIENRESYLPKSFRSQHLTIEVRSGRTLMWPLHLPI